MSNSDEISRDERGYREGDVEVWYDGVEKETFQTEFIEIEPEDARAIIATFYQEATDEQNMRIERLKDEIDKCIKSFPAQAAFVRLSHLSPKDGALTMAEKLLFLFRQNIKKTQLDRSSEFIELNRAIYQLCKSETGQDAMSFFIKSNRTVKHFQSQLQKITEITPWKMNIVVREWNEISPEYEFRAFVYGRKLTAITHYYKFCYVQDIAINKEKYQKLMEDYFENISHMIPENCVLDFCILPETEKVKIVELNPWSVHASSALFDWGKDIQCLKGEAPFEFRISEKPYYDLMERISGSLRILWQMARPLRYEEGEELPRNVERVIYTFKWSSYKNLPFYAFTRHFSIQVDVDWELVGQQAVSVMCRDGLQRCFWENSPRFFEAVRMKIRSYTNSETKYPPHWISTLNFIILIESAVISFKGKRMPDHIKEILPFATAAYQWIFDVFEHFDQPTALKDKNSTICLYVHNTCSALQSHDIIARK